MYPAKPLVWYASLRSPFMDLNKLREVRIFDSMRYSYCGFLKNSEESCVYKKASGSMVVFLILYVDDILIIGNDIWMMQGVKAYLCKNFSMKDLGEASYVLGIKLYRDRERKLIGLSQSTYIDKILEL